jgi:hypothetical protein
MSRKLILPALVALASIGGPVMAQEPTSSEKKAEMIRRVDSLEVHPYGNDADGSRKAVMEWLTDAPDVTVTVCGALLGDVEKLEGEKDDPGLLLQLMFAEARFILQHPEQAQDEKAVHTAGLKGALAFYDAMKKERPGVKFATIERIAKANADGKLDDLVSTAIKKCN